MELSTDNDSQLIALLQADEPAALEELMRRYRHPLHNFCRRLLGNDADADDIAQETFVRVYQQRARIQPDAKFSTWLFTVARNQVIDRLRWRKRHPAEPLESAPEPSALTDPADEPARRELESAIAAAIHELPEEQRTAIVLAEYHGLSHAEIADIMQCSEKSVESRLYRARQALRHPLRAWLPQDSFVSL